MNAKNDFKSSISLRVYDNDDDGELYYYGGLCNHYLNLKEAACHDWSKAGELGYKDAYDFIAKYCQEK